jgi:hypothetical protein
MSPGGVLRVVAFTGVVLLFVGSLVAIVLSGPVVVRVQKLVFDDRGISQERLRADVVKLCSECTPRDYTNSGNLDRAAVWIEEELREAGLEVERQEYRLAEGIFRNVVAIRRGRDLSAGVTVVGAHYDAYREFPGANDNASGVAVLLELARTLPDPPPRRDQYFVAFSTEEPPFFGSESMGSHAFAEDLLESGRSVQLMISLDVVGYYSDDPGSQGFPLPGLGLLYPRRGDFVAVVGDLRSGRWIDRVKRGMKAVNALPVHSLRAPSALAPVLLSDHFSFRQLGLPGVHVTDTAFMRDPTYHTRDDTPDRLDYTRMARLVEALHGVLWEGPQD